MTRRTEETEWVRSGVGDRKMDVEQMGRKRMDLGRGL